MNPPEHETSCGCEHEYTKWLTVPRDWQRPATSGAHQLYWCHKCMFGKLLPPPDEATVAAFYIIEKYYTHGFDQHGKKKSHDRGTASGHAILRMLDRLRTRLAWANDKSLDIDTDWIKNRFGAPGKRFCDIGCGGGYLLGMLARAGFPAIGIEPDPVARNVATERGLRVLAGTAEKLPEEISTQKFDVVFMLHALEHCIDPRKAIRNARSLLSPGGHSCGGNPKQRGSWHEERRCRMAMARCSASSEFFHTREFERNLHRCRPSHRRHRVYGLCKAVPPRMD